MSPSPWRRARSMSSTQPRSRRSRPSPSKERSTTPTSRRTASSWSAAPLPSKTITVIDQKTEEPVWSLVMDQGIRPMAFATNPGRKHQMDLRPALRLQRIRRGGFRHAQGNQSDQEPRSARRGRLRILVGGSESHGMAVTPDGKTLIVNSRLNSADLFVLASRLEAAGQRRRRPVSGLGHAHARRQDGLRGMRRIELRLRGRYQIHERGHPHSGRRSAEAEYHGRPPVRFANVSSHALFVYKRMDCNLDSAVRGR